MNASLTQIELIVGVLKTTFLILATFYTNYKMVNQKIYNNVKSIFKMILIIIISIVCAYIKFDVNYIIWIVSLVLIISIIFNKDNISKSIITTIISLSINYSLTIVTIAICFFINKFINIKDDYINMFIMNVIHLSLILSIFKMRKFNKGISFLKKNDKNDYIDILVLNISVIILISVIIIVNYNIMIALDATLLIIISIFMAFITIQKSLQLYYKQKLLIQELNESKEKLESKTKEVEELEKENLRISKKSHTLVHKQKSLEFKLQEMLLKSEISKEETTEVKERIKELEKDLYGEKVVIKIDETKIPEIDDMLKYMQAECNKNKIEFEVQIKGNIYYMINNLIDKKDLETLLADHIKNAIIAINHTKNINRSIFVRLGKIDEIYGLYIYDSGEEFKIETLKELGKKPITTHEDEGGTGMGFMNTFETLKNCKASLIIEEYNKPSKENYTKVLMIKFDGKNEFKIKSYREKDIYYKK